MSWQSILQAVVLIGLLLLAVPPLGKYIAATYGSRGDGTAYGDRFFTPVERFIYRVCGINEQREQRWSVYAMSMLAFSVLSVFGVYLVLRLQGSLPLNPADKTSIAPFGAFNIAVSFVTNTNWQWYSGEVAMSHFTQMVSLAVQNFVSAAVGLAIVMGIIRGITRSGIQNPSDRNSSNRNPSNRNLGNFWVDLTRSVTRILLPLSAAFAVVLVSQGAIQNFKGGTTATPLDGASGVATQFIPGGPTASQVAIKQVGTNGGGFFNANSAHPFESPNGITNILEVFGLLLIPFSVVVAFGYLVKDRRQSRLLLVAMAGILVVMASVATFAEQNGNARLTEMNVDQSISTSQSGGNMEGKETRFGASSSGIFAAATTGTSTGAVNAMHDSFTPIGGAAPMISMMLGEVSPGGVGVGLMGMLIYALLAVFIAGLMVGRTPEYLGKKIQATEMKLLTLYILAMPVVMLAFAGASVLLESAVSTTQGGTHGFSEILYNYASSSNNNGSAFAFQGTGTDWYTITQGISMLVGRFFLIIPALAIGGSLAAKPRAPETSGTLPTHNPLFGGLVIGVIAIVAGLTFFPALALGPILEHLSI